jgi:ankyrin repeat protein
MCPQAGADVNSANPDTPLVVATKYGLADCIKYLLEAGADPNIPDKEVSLYSSQSFVILSICQIL